MPSENVNSEPSDIAQVFDYYLMYKDDVRYLESKNMEERQAEINRLELEHQSTPSRQTGQKLKDVRTHHRYMVEVAKASRDGLQIIEKNHPEISKLAEMFEKEWKAKWEAERSAAAAERKTAEALGKDGSSGDQTSGEQDSDDDWRTWSHAESTAWIQHQVGRSMSEDRTGSPTMLHHVAGRSTVS